jgi:hypothetical protein
LNITENNVITSISCHKNISENEVNSIVLDFYFYRTFNIKRIDKNKTNVTLIIEKVGDSYFIRETNGGICDIYNGSFFPTYMNIKKDTEGNLISYDEYTFTNITTLKNIILKKLYKFIR